MDEELLKKTKSKKNRGVMIAAVLIAFCILGFAGFKILGPGAGGQGAKDSEGMVTVTIECRELADHMDKLKKPELKKYIPEGGMILDSEKYDFKKDESVYDALEAVCMKNKIQVESSEDTLYKSRYIEGINYLYEKDAGKKSGWIYTVNGETPNYGASKVKLVDKDKIIWHYTVDYENTEMEG